MKDYRLAALGEEPDLVLWVVCMTPLRYSVILECLDGVLRVSPSKQEGRGWPWSSNASTMNDQFEFRCCVIYSYAAHIAAIRAPRHQSPPHGKARSFGDRRWTAKPMPLLKCQLLRQLHRRWWWDTRVLSPFSRPVTGLNL